MVALCAANRARRRRRRRAPALTPSLQTLFPLSPSATAALRQGGGLLSPSHAAANQRILERATAFRACVRGPCGGSASQMSRAAKSSGCARIRALAAARFIARHPTSPLGAETMGDDKRRRCNDGAASAPPQPGGATERHEVPRSEGRPGGDLGRAARTVETQGVILCGVHA